MPATMPFTKDQAANPLLAADRRCIADVDDFSKAAVRREQKQATKAGG